MRKRNERGGRVQIRLTLSFRRPRARDRERKLQWVSCHPRTCQPRCAHTQAPSTHARSFSEPSQRARKSGPLKHWGRAALFSSPHASLSHHPFSLHRRLDDPARGGRVPGGRRGGDDPGVCEERRMLNTFSRVRRAVLPRRGEPQQARRTPAPRPLSYAQPLALPPCVPKTSPRGPKAARTRALSRNLPFFQPRPRPLLSPFHRNATPPPPHPTPPASPRPPAASWAPWARP